MFPTLRLTMSWLHTWAGLVLGFLLFVVFFFGSLSVFDREIDRWAIPATRFAPQPMPSYDALLAPAFARITPDADDLAAARSRADGDLSAPLPVMDFSAYTTHRDPVLTLYKSFALPEPHVPGDHIHGHVTLDPRDGSVLPEGQRAIGSGFFYPMHYGLHIEWRGLGYWLVGLAALAMLVALVSGVVIHRRLLREFFTFRPGKGGQRSLLDLHNLTGVVALPFHFLFALSGLVIFAAIYFPAGTTLLRPLADADAQRVAAAAGLPFAPAGRPATLASVDAMVAEAQRRWAANGRAGDVGFLFVNHVGDANATVSIYRAGTDRVALTGDGIHFRGTTGDVLRVDPPQAAPGRINEFLTGLHLQHFRHWLLRFLYFTGGLAGCACIATGLVFFVNKRRAAAGTVATPGLRLAEVVAIGTVTGTIVAALAMLVGNRLLPPDLPARAAIEEGVFWAAWALAFGHAAWRLRRSGDALAARRAWRDQAATIATLAMLAVAANAASTGDHLLRTIGAGYWPVAGVDLVLLGTALVAALTARRLAGLPLAARSAASQGDVRFAPDGIAR
jgi:uncharacterized iron-regulated membrane protein